MVPRKDNTGWWATSTSRNLSLRFNNFTLIRIDRITTEDVSLAVYDPGREITVRLHIPLDILTELIPFLDNATKTK